MAKAINGGKKRKGKGKQRRKYEEETSGIREILERESL